jgi:hypothetical protein
MKKRKKKRKGKVHDLIVMEEVKWVIQVNDELKHMVDTSMGMEQWKRHSIYKVPACDTNLNSKAYIPQAVSFNPYLWGGTWPPPKGVAAQPTATPSLFSIFFLKKNNC